MSQQAEQPTLYVSWTGRPQIRMSFSMANSIDQCGQKTEFERIQGYEPLERGAYFAFGQAVEGAIKGWVGSGCTRDISDEFSAIWIGWKDDKKIVYKDSEKDWAHMDSMGRRLVQRFQQAYESGKLPMLNEHKFSEELLLPDWYEGTDLIYIADAIRPRSLLIDIKTSERNRPGNFKDLVRLDRQLRVGSLVSGVREVGFIVGAWGNSGTWEYMPGTLTDELVKDVDLWLKAQRGKYLRKEFFRAGGTLFPNQVCTNCDFLKACLDGNFEGLRRRETSDAMDQLEAMAD